MKNCVFIGIGGFFGAISRYLGESLDLKAQGGGLPINTLFINISGCFLLAMFLTLTLEWLKMDESLKLSISTGFLGSYTTFSTFCKEVCLLFSSGQYTSAGLYMALSVLLCLAAAFLGYLSAKKIACRIKKSNKYKTGCLTAIDEEADED